MVISQWTTITCNSSTFFCDFALAVKTKNFGHWFKSKARHFPPGNPEYTMPSEKFNFAHVFIVSGGLTDWYTQFLDPVIIFIE